VVKFMQFMQLLRDSGTPASQRVQADQEKGVGTETGRPGVQDDRHLIVPVTGSDPEHRPGSSKAGGSLEITASVRQGCLGLYSMT